MLRQTEWLVTHKGRVLRPAHNSDRNLQWLTGPVPVSLGVGRDASERYMSDANTRDVLVNEADLKAPEYPISRFMKHGECLD